jgi:hypothetical protein
MSGDFIVGFAGLACSAGGWWLCAVGRPTQKRPYCSFFASAFRSYSEGQEEVLPLRPLAAAAAGWRCCACLLVALVVVHSHSRFTYVKH